MLFDRFNIDFHIDSIIIPQGKFCLQYPVNGIAIYRLVFFGGPKKEEICLAMRNAV